MISTCYTFALRHQTLFGCRQWEVLHLRFGCFVWGGGIFRPSIMFSVHFACMTYAILPFSKKYQSVIYCIILIPKIKWLRAPSWNKEYYRNRPDSFPTASTIHSSFSQTMSVQWSLVHCSGYEWNSFGYIRLTDFLIILLLLASFRLFLPIHRVNSQRATLWLNTADMRFSTPNNQSSI